MRRRAFLATVGTVALAGCTASGESDSPDPEAYSVAGLKDSEVYTGAYVMQLKLFDTGRLFGRGGIRVGFTYDATAEYDPSDHDVYLMDGERVVAEGEMPNPFMNDEPAIEVDIYADDLERTQTYRLVSMGVTGPVDEFELELIRE